MRIELNLETDAVAIEPLRDAWRTAAARHHGHHHALAKRARLRHQQLAGAALPPLVREPLALIPSLADLLSDPHWEIEAEARENFAGALAYFVEPDDLIPDDGSRFGFLDDALVLKVVLAETRHEWFAWCEYTDYLAAHPEEAGIDRATWMLHRRERLDAELRKRNDQGYAPSGRRDVGFAESYAPAAEGLGRFGVR